MTELTFVIRKNNTYKQIRLNPRGFLVSKFSYSLRQFSNLTLR